MTISDLSKPNKFIKKCIEENTLVLCDGVKFKDLTRFTYLGDNYFHGQTGYTYEPLNVQEQIGLTAHWTIKKISAEKSNFSFIPAPQINEPQAFSPAQSLVIARFIYLHTCPFNPVEIVINNKIVLNADHPSGIIHALYIELCIDGKVKLIIYPSDDYYFNILHTKLPVCFFTRNNNAIIIETYDTSILHNCFITIKNLLDTATYKKEDKFFPHAQFGKTIETHFNALLADSLQCQEDYPNYLSYEHLTQVQDALQTALDEKAKGIVTFFKNKLNSITDIEELPYESDYHNPIKHLPPIFIKYTFDPLLDAKFPNEMPRLTKAILNNDLNLLQDILNTSPSELLQCDAWHRTPDYIARLLIGVNIDRKKCLELLTEKRIAKKWIGQDLLNKTNLLLNGSIAISNDLREQQACLIDIYKSGECYPSRPRLHQLIILRNQNKVHFYDNEIEHLILTQNNNLLDPHGFTPLMIAAAYGDSLVVSLLLAYGAQPNPSSAQNSLSDRSCVYDTLECGVQSQNFETVKLLLMHGCHIKSGRPFQLAVKHVIYAQKEILRKENLQIVDLLLHYKAIIGVYKNGIHPIDLAKTYAILTKKNDLLNILLYHSNAFIAQTALPKIKTIIITQNEKAASYFFKMKKIPKLLPPRFSPEEGALITPMADSFDDIEMITKRVIDLTFNEIHQLIKLYATSFNCDSQTIAIKKNIQDLLNKPIDELALSNLILLIKYLLTTSNNQYFISSLQNIENQLKDWLHLSLSECYRLIARYKNIKNGPTLYHLTIKQLLTELHHFSTILPYVDALLESLFNVKKNEISHWYIEYCRITLNKIAKIASFFIFKVTEEQHEKVGNFILISLQICAVDNRYNGKRLAMLLLELTPFVFEAIQNEKKENKPVIVCYAALYPWAGIISLNNRLAHTPHYIVEPELMAFLAKKINYQLMTQNGVIKKSDSHSAILISRLEQEKQQHTQEQQLIIALNPSFEIHHPRMVVYQANKSALQNFSASWHYRGITVSHFKLLIAEWKRFLEEGKQRPSLQSKI